MMKERLQEIRERALEQINSTDSLEKLNEVRVSILGKKGELTEVLKGMKDVEPKDRPMVGQIVNETRQAIEEVLENARKELSEKMREIQMKAEVIDVTLPAKKNNVGHSHPNTLALEEIKFKDIFKVMFKEFRIALVVGVALAIVNGIRIYIMYRNQFTFSTVLLSFTIGFTLMLIVILSELIGCILPMVAQKLKLDPAIMASPLITTIVDTFSVFVFFKVAMLLLPM